MGAAKCPSCGKLIELGPKPRMGQKVRCFDCDERLEVVWLDPLEVDWPEEEYELDEDEEDEDW
jgi:hypothetical protein